MGIVVVKPEYTFVKLTPNNSIRNTDTHLIARTIADMYRGLWSCLKREEEKALRFFKKDFYIGTKYSFSKQGKISYYIYMEKEKIEFYFIIPTNLMDIMKERIGGVWNGITIKVVEEIPTFSSNAFKYQMVYQMEDGLSLKTDRKDNALLNSSLNVVDLMEKGDRAGILYNFIPVKQGTFIHSYNSTLEKVKKGLPTERNKKGVSFLFKMSLAFIDMLLKDITEALAGKNQKVEEDSLIGGILDKLNGGRDVSPSTNKKIKGHVLDTQILVMSESEDRHKARSYAVSMTQGFDILSDDNRLVKKKHKGEVNFMAKQLPGVEVNRVGDQEVQNFISIAGRELLERYPFADKVETQETVIPKDLQKGALCIGTSTYRGNAQKVYLSDDEQYRKLMLLLIGPSRAGKSNLIAHLSADAIENGECVILFDFIKNCELSKGVSKLFPKEKTLEIACDDFNKLQGIGYNEVGYSDDPFKQYENAKRQTANTSALVNSVNDQSGDTAKLSPKMERYLEAACLAVYITGGSVKDVIGVLMNHVTRHRFISLIPKNQMENLGEYIDSLRELDERKDGEVVGTKNQPGIIDRLNALKRNTYMELMLKKGTENNLNLVEEMQKNQLIVIKMPQAMFTTDGEKDVFTTYWMTKIWFALQIRADKYEEKDLKLVNLVIDEIYQVENTERFMKSKLSQVAKFNIKPIISCHYINQLKYMREELRSANTSYMLVQGCDEKNFTELKNDLYPYTAEDLSNLKRYHSLNRIKTANGYANFVTKLPPEISTRFQMKKSEARKGLIVKITDDEILFEKK